MSKILLVHPKCEMIFEALLDFKIIATFVFSIAPQYSYCSSSSSPLIPFIYFLHWFMGYLYIILSVDLAPLTIATAIGVALFFSKSEKEQQLKREREVKKRSKELIPKIKQRRLRAITLQRAIEKSRIY